MPKTPLRDCRHSLLLCYLRSLLIVHPIHTSIRTTPSDSNPFSLTRTCRCRWGPDRCLLPHTSTRRILSSFVVLLIPPVNSLRHYTLLTGPRKFHRLLPRSGCCACCTWRDENILCGALIEPIYLSCAQSLSTGLEHHQRDALRPHHPQRQVHIARSS